jgi:hypothetical protein
MASDPNEVHSETDAARAGSTPNIVRWVLGISLFAAIALLSVIWITGAATQGDDEDEISVTAKYHDPVRDETEDTDSIVGEDADEIDAAEPGDADAPGAPTVENEAN